MDITLEEKILSLVLFERFPEFQILLSVLNENLALLILVCRNVEF